MHKRMPQTTHKHLFSTTAPAFIIGPIRDAAQQADECSGRGSHVVRLCVSKTTGMRTHYMCHLRTLHNVLLLLLQDKHQRHRPRVIG